jgi:predicted GH43/DUF377 family glycosyl hydrolase
MKRYEQNPIIQPSDVKPSREDFEVIGVFNAGVAKYNDKVILLLRVAEKPKDRKDGICRSVYYDINAGEIKLLEFDQADKDLDLSDSRWIKTPSKNYITSISHFRMASSEDGIHFDIQEKPCMSASNLYEIYGIEDPRITQMNKDYYISYSAISDVGITECLAVTTDFNTFERLGVIFHPDNKDVEIFPEKIGGYYYALNRPSTSLFGKPDIWIAKSPDLICWGDYRYLMGAREGSWDNGRIGGSAIPVRTEQGWLEIYHGATKEDVYCLGAVLLKLDEPYKVIARSTKPILKPETDYEKEGFFGGVVFSCGVILEDKLVRIYYGAADTCMCYAEATLEEIMDTLEDVV